MCVGQPDRVEHFVLDRQVEMYVGQIGNFRLGTSYVLPPSPMCCPLSWQTSICHPGLPPPSNPSRKAPQAWPPVSGTWAYPHLYNPSLALVQPPSDLALCAGLAHQANYFHHYLLYSQTFENNPDLPIPQQSAS